MDYNTAVLSNLCFFVFLVLNASGTPMPQKNETKGNRKKIYSLLSTTLKPDRKLMEYKKMQENELAERSLTTTPDSIWVDSYYIEDDSYPVLRAEKPLPENPISKGSKIVWAQLIPLINNMIFGAKDMSRKRGFVPNRQWKK